MSLDSSSDDDGGERFARVVPRIPSSWEPNSGASAGVKEELGGEGPSKRAKVEHGSAVLAPAATSASGVQAGSPLRPTHPPDAAAPVAPPCVAAASVAERPVATTQPPAPKFSGEAPDEQLSGAQCFDQIFGKSDHMYAAGWDVGLVMTEMTKKINNFKPFVGAVAGQKNDTEADDEQQFLSDLKQAADEGLPSSGSSVANLFWASVRKNKTLAAEYKAVSST